VAASSLFSVQFGSGVDRQLVANYAPCPNHNTGTSTLLTPLVLLLVEPGNTLEVLLLRALANRAGVAQKNEGGALGGPTLDPGPVVWLLEALAHLPALVAGRCAVPWG
jgi:hypothetical protein